MADYEKNQESYEKSNSCSLFVMVHKVALTLLRNGQINIQNIDCIVFDECHHARTEHPYNLIMREFYFYGIDYSDEVDEIARYKDRPYILGLTASPIKTKIKQSSIASVKFEMVDEIKELCSNLNCKIVTTNLENVDKNILANHSNHFIKYDMKSYWGSLDFIKNPLDNIPHISSIIEQNKEEFDQEKLEIIRASLDTFDSEIMEALKNKHAKLEISHDITPEKATQIAGNHYKLTLSQINIKDFPNEVKVMVIMTIAFMIYLDNVILNVGVLGLVEFIKDFISKFKDSEIKSNSKVIHQYLKKWKEFSDNLIRDNKGKLLCPKIEKLIDTFFDETIEEDHLLQNEDQMIIFVDQRLVADLLYKVLLSQEIIKYPMDVVYSHSNRGVLPKIMKKLNSQSSNSNEMIEDIINLENVSNRSLTQQRKSLEDFKSGKCKILIATNVIEEGLDIPQCNTIVIYDKIQTPKTYIQMAGRARKSNSTIYFFCLSTEYYQIESGKPNN